MLGQIDYITSHRCDVSYGEWSKSIYAKHYQLFLRLPKKKQQSDGRDEEKKLQDSSKQIADILPLQKETVYESLRKLLKEARNIDIHRMLSIAV